MKNKHGKVLTPGPHFPRHMHHELTHGHVPKPHRHFRNDDNEVSDRLRFNINYMEVPQAHHGSAHSNDIFDLPNTIEEDNDMEPNMFDS